MNTIVDTIVDMRNNVYLKTEFSNKKISLHIQKVTFLSGFKKASKLCIQHSILNMKIHVLIYLDT